MSFEVIPVKMCVTNVCQDGCHGHHHDDGHEEGREILHDVLAECGWGYDYSAG